MAYLQSFSFFEEGLPVIARQVLDLLHEKPLVMLHGVMGAGKTTLVRAIAHELGFESEAGSPTFSIINEYHCTGNHWNIRMLYHMDLYRLNSREEALDLGILEYLDSGTICIIEWPELIEGVADPEKILNIQLEVLENQQRNITLSF